MSPQYSDLKEKIVLVTGAMRGIGKAVAESLARQGAHVVFNYRQEDDVVYRFKDQLESLGATKATPLKFDLRNNSEITSAINDFVKNVGAISGLVNNAGISKDQILFRLKEEDLSETLDINLKGPILVAAALSRSFLKAENVSVVNISSVAGLMGNNSQVSYSASKSGLIGFTKSMAKELGSRNIRCNAVCPGFIETDMTKALDEKVIEHYKSQIPLGRFGSVEDVANLCLFLLSRASGYMTGEVIKVDGGLYI